MITVVVVDDHPALRTGVTALLTIEPGISPLGAAANEAELWPLVYGSSPDVVILDYHLPGANGLQLCRRLKARSVAPAVLIFSGYPEATLALPARLAGADGILDKAAPAGDLLLAVRAVASGETVFPDLSRERLNAASARLDPDDLPVLAMLLDRTTHTDIAETLGIDVATVNLRIDHILLTLGREAPAGP